MNGIAMSKGVFASCVLMKKKRSVSISGRLIAGMKNPAARPQGS
jgi:hypothetical protein